MIVDHIAAFSTRSSMRRQSSSSSLNLNFDSFFNNLNVNNKASKTAVIAGASGYIGKATVRESVRQGYNTIALVRDLKKVQSEEGKLLYGRFFEGAKLVEADVCDLETLKTVSYLLQLSVSFI
jgi:short-subunit dehydrogenase